MYRLIHGQKNHKIDFYIEDAKSNSRLSLKQMICRSRAKSSKLSNNCSPQYFLLKRKEQKDNLFQLIP
uniref:Uncharacterized protein n=1 Tax=Onchocerca volvulus TaxID=6282 RepID=A0A8R1TLK8_ONCVO